MPHKVSRALFGRQAWIKIRRFLLSLNTPVAAQHRGNSQMYPEISHNSLAESEVDMFLAETERSEHELKVAGLGR